MTKALLTVALVSLMGGCLPRPPQMMAPVYRADAGKADSLDGSTWLEDPMPGDRYAVAGDDLVWRDEALIGPADDRSGKCSVDARGTIHFVAPKTPGEWPCLLRACRETCWVSRVTLVVEANSMHKASTTRP